MAERELHKILAVGEDTYKINAVHSDAAGQVDKTLTVNKSMLTSVEPVEFNGSEDKEVSVVPSEGGAFTGPVILPSLVNVNESLNSFVENLDIGEDSELSKDEIKEQLLKAAAINYSDVLETVQNLTGHPCYQWDGQTLTEVIDPEPEEGAQGEDSIALQKIRIVTGSVEDYSAFIATNPVFFLYFCSDTGQMFFGMDPDNYLELGTNTKQLIFDEDFEFPEGVDNHSGYTAEDILTLETTVGEHTSTISGLQSEWQSDIADAIGSAKTDITGGNVATADKLKTAQKVIVDLAKTGDNATKVTFDGSAGVDLGVKGTLGVAGGGTGKATHTANAILTGNGTSAVKNVATASGAFYATSANGAPVFGTLPIGQGGTGATTDRAASCAILKNMNQVESAIDDTSRLVFRYSGTNATTTNGAVYYRSASMLLDYINSKASLAASRITSGTLSEARGGTGASKLADVTVGAATKATKDSDDLTINKNYFRSASCVTNEKNKYVNSITVSQSAPSGGNNGDIWIVY